MPRAPGFLKKMRIPIKVPFRNRKPSTVATSFAHYVTEFEGFDLLRDVGVILVETTDGWDSVDKAVEEFEQEEKVEFNPIPFAIRDVTEKERPTILYAAHIAYQVNGFAIRGLVKEEEEEEKEEEGLLDAINSINPASGKEEEDTQPEKKAEVQDLMHVVLRSPNNRKDDLNKQRSVGTLEHPQGGTLYKIGKIANRANMGISDVVIQKATGDDIGQTACRISPFYNPLRTILVCMGLEFDSNEFYIVKHGKDYLARIKPKFRFKGNSYLIKYGMACKDIQTKAAILGFTLMLLLTNGYPEITRIMKRGRAGVDSNAGYGTIE